MKEPLFGGGGSWVMGVLGASQVADTATKAIGW